VARRAGLRRRKIRGGSGKYGEARRDFHWPGIRTVSVDAKVRAMSDESSSAESDILLYTTPNGDVRVEVYYQAETFWLTLNRMAELFGSSKQAISYHLQNIFTSNELGREATVKVILTVQSEGGRQVVAKNYLESGRRAGVRHQSDDSVVSRADPGPRGSPWTRTSPNRISHGRSRRGRRLRTRGSAPPNQSPYVPLRSDLFGWRALGQSSHSDVAHLRWAQGPLPESL